MLLFFERYEQTLVRVMNKRDKGKYNAACLALAEEIRVGMAIGLGSGSTADYFTRALGERSREGLALRTTATSRATAKLAERVGLIVEPLDDLAPLDIVIDGCDEIDADFNMIKGGGGCLLGEKIIAAATRRMVVICDGSKEVNCLGSYPLPVEVIPFGWRSTRAMVAAELRRQHGRDAAIDLRGGEATPFMTDHGHYILDCGCGSIIDPRGLEKALMMIPGCVEIGLFTHQCDIVFIGDEDGRCRVRKRAP